MFLAKGKSRRMRGAEPVSNGERERERERERQRRTTYVNLGQKIRMQNTP